MVDNFDELILGLEIMSTYRFVVEVGNEEMLALCFHNQRVTSEKMVMRSSRIYHNTKKSI